VGERIPGPMCVTSVGQSFVDLDTSVRTRSNVPGPTSVVTLSLDAKLREVLIRAAARLPGEAGDQLLALVSPESIMIMAGTLLAWAGSHLFGVGEIVDAILLAVGFITLGASVITGGKELALFASCTVSAQSGAELEAAAEHLATAVATLGIATIMTVLMVKNAHGVATRRPPPANKSYLLKRGLLEVDTPPPAGARPTIQRPKSLPSGALGETDWYGSIKVVRSQTFDEQRITLYHEWIHSVLSPRVAPLRQLRASLKASAYHRSALLRYLEEAMAEAYGQAKVSGFIAGLKQVSFPVGSGYVTLSQLASEGVAIGTIDVMSGLFTVYFVEGELEAPRPE
jgi:hypothetical protein